MARVLVDMDKVRCRDTEDVTGADEFYIGGVVTDGKKTESFMTKQLKINDGQTKDLGLGVVFDHDVPRDRVVKVTFAAFDADSNRDWEEHKKAIRAVEATVTGALAATRNPYAIAAATLVPFVVEGIGAGMRLDKDDRLGDHADDYPVWSLDDPVVRHAKFAKSGGGWFANYSSWDYTVSYSVKVR